MKILGKGSIIARGKVKERKRCRYWELAVTVQYDDGTKDRPTRKFRGTYTQAQEALEEFKAELLREAEGFHPGDDIDSGIALPKGVDVPFPEYADEWIAYLRSTHAYARRTIVGYESKLKTAKMHLRCGVRQITCRMIEAMYSACMNGETLSGKPWTAKSVDGLNRVLSSLLHDAKVRPCPTDGVHLPKPKAKRKTVYEDAEIDAIIDGLDLSQGGARGALLCAAGGLRRSEAVAVQWRDLRGGCIYVETSLEDDGDEKTTKNEEIRAVPLPPDVYEKLDARRGRPQEPICGGMRPDSLDQWWDRNRGDLSASCTLHELRHAWATRLARHHVHPAIIQRLGGWKTSYVPMQIYTHVSASMAMDAILAAFETRTKPRAVFVRQSSCFRINVTAERLFDRLR